MPKFPKKPRAIGGTEKQVDKEATAPSTEWALLLRRNVHGFLSNIETENLYAHMSGEVRSQVAGIYKLRNVEAVRLIHGVLIEHGTIEKFLDEQPFYADFGKTCKALGLAGDFDRTEKVYPIQVRASDVSKPDLRAGTGVVLAAELGKLDGFQVFEKFSEEAVEKAFEADLQKVHAKIISVDPLSDEFVEQVQKYYLALFRLAKFRYRKMIERLNVKNAEDRQLDVLSGLNEFYRDKLGNEIIALEKNAQIKLALETFLSVEMEELNGLFKNFDLSNSGQDDLGDTAKTEDFQLEMDRRDADSTARGVISSDCTDIRRDFAFHETVPQHLLDPGFLNLKLRHGKGVEKPWVGNNYLLVMNRNGKPILVVDAIQTSEEYKFPCQTTALAEKVLEGICRYAQEMGFKEVHLSRFVSNRGVLNHYFGKKYPLDVVHVEKVGGFRHLKDLQLWQEDAFRNEYLETLMAGKPNEESQELPLRLVAKFD